MSNLHRLLLIVFVCVATFSFFDVENTTTLTTSLYDPPREMGDKSSSRLLAQPFSAPVGLSPERANHLELTLSSPGYAVFGVLEVVGTGRALDLVEDRGRPGEHRRSCTFSPPSSPGAAGTCRIPLRTGDRARHEFILAADNGPATITSLHFEPASAKRQATASGKHLFWMFVLLFALGPAFFYLQRSPRLEAAVGIAISALWLSFAGLTALLIVLSFLAISYFALQWVAGSGRGQMSRFVAALCATIVLLLFLKFAAPHVTAAFANPGGFALALPLGLSYIAIRFVDLLLTAYGGHLPTIRLLDYLFFMLYPQTLAAGPIFTYDRFVASRIENYDVVDFAAGATRMGLGVTKKIAADNLVLPIVATNMQVFASSPAQPSPMIAAMLLANVLYVYLDFSAYCDIAIGAGRAAGRKVPENFDWPLVRSGLRQFWQHWHMTLSNWVMRRVYFPAFLSSRSQTAALTASMMVIGLWHVPNLSWATWAIHHALAMRVEGALFPPGSHQRVKPIALRRLRYIGGMVFLWIWVALGHSFTLFSSFEYAIRAYFGAVAGAIFPGYWTAAWQ